MICSVVRIQQAIPTKITKKPPPKSLQHRSDPALTQMNVKKLNTCERKNTSWFKLKFESKRLLPMIYVDYIVTHCRTSVRGDCIFVYPDCVLTHWMLMFRLGSLQNTSGSQARCTLVCWSNQAENLAAYSGIIQGWFLVCAQPMRNGISLQRRLSSLKSAL